MVHTFGENLDAWIDDMSKLASRFTSGFEARFGYQPGENVLLKATPERGLAAAGALAAVGAHRDLLDFYLRVDEVRLPDVGNGLFIHSAQAIVDGVADGQPTKVVGAAEDDITVFASDGGGALFVLNHAGNRVYRLGGGSLVGSEYDVDDAVVRVVVAGFSDFLEYVYQELSRMV